MYVCVCVCVCKSVTQEEVCQLKKKVVPKSTNASTRWAIKILMKCFVDYNDRNPKDRCPDAVLSQSCSLEELNKWLIVFIIEMQNLNCYLNYLKILTK